MSGSDDQRPETEEGKEQPCKAGRQGRRDSANDPFRNDEHADDHSPEDNDGAD